MGLVFEKEPLDDPFESIRWGPILEKEPLDSIGARFRKKGPYTIPSIQFKGALLKKGPLYDPFDSIGARFRKNGPFQFYGKGTFSKTVFGLYSFILKHGSTTVVL
jgi:hypothetical protein